MPEQIQSGGEEYSRKKYDAAERELERTKKDITRMHEVAENVVERPDNSSDLRRQQRAIWSEHFQNVVRDEAEAQARLDNLYNKGEDEARALGVEYNHLKENVQHAIEELEAFQKDKLDMKSGGEEQGTKTETEE